MYDVFDLNVPNVSDCVKDAEAMIYQGLWDTGPFTGGGHSSTVQGRGPPGYGPTDIIDRDLGKLDRWQTGRC